MTGERGGHLGSRRRGRIDRGQAVVEVALVLPLVALLLVLVGRVAAVARTEVLVVHAAREAARAAAVTEGDVTGAARVGAARAGALDAADLDVAVTDLGDRVRVEVHYHDATSLPLLSALPSVEHHATVVMTREPSP